RRRARATPRRARRASPHPPDGRSTDGGPDVRPRGGTARRPPRAPSSGRGAPTAPRRAGSPRTDPSAVVLQKIKKWAGPTSVRAEGRKEGSYNTRILDPQRRERSRCCRIHAYISSISRRYRSVTTLRFTLRL